MSTTKKALLIGCNYPNQSNRLYGCINDVINIANTLVDAFDYDLNNITVLRDDSKSSNNVPTRSNIMNHLNALANNSGHLSEIWIHYSGHGSQIRDNNKDENDNLDEIIMPTDFKNAGSITDDDIFNILKNISSRCRVILCFDSCHSGSICDLTYGFQTNGTPFTMSNKKLTNPNLYCFSGSKDAQTSADTYSNIESRNVGAFTTVFLYCLRLNHFNVDAVKLYADICKLITANGFQQIPQFSSSSQNVKLIFERISYRNVATLNNPTPGFLSLSKSIVSTRSMPVLKHSKKITMVFN